ncbi:MAG: hypothetical protein AB1584_18775 [Pseudomonadota bacterium]
MTKHRACLRAFRLWALVGAAQAGQPGAAGIVPLAGDDPALARPAQCAAAVLALPPTPGGAPRELMRIGNGVHAHARFAALAGAGGRRALEERLVDLTRNGREERGRGRFRVVYGGALPIGIDPLAFETYRVTLDLKAEGGCDARGGVPCARYAGTLQADYRFRGFGKEVPTISAPPQPVQLFEWCAREQYRYYGMFAFPTWLDKMGGVLLRSR